MSNPTTAAAPSAADPPAPRSALVRLVVICCLTYMLSHFFRASHAVIAPELVREFALGPEALSLLSATFFLVFAALQIPLGMVNDRFGPRLALFPMLAFTVAGAVLFGLAGSATELTIARTLMGVGVAGIMVSSVMLFSRWARPESYAALSGLLFGAGTSGGLVATAPLAYMAEAIGWREAFFVAAGVTVVLGTVGFLLVRDAPPGHAPRRGPPENFRQIAGGVFEVLRSVDLLRVAAVSMVNYPATAAVLVLWASPYLADVYGLDTVARGNVLLVMTVAMIAGYLLYGQADRMGLPRKRVVASGLLTMIAALVALAIGPFLAVPMPVWVVTALFSVLGIASALGALLVAYVRILFPPRLLGRATTVNNMALVAGTALLQMLTGAVAGLFPTTAGALPGGAYAGVFLVLAGITLAALLVFLPMREPPGR